MICWLCDPRNILFLALPYLLFTPKAKLQWKMFKKNHFMLNPSNSKYAPVYLLRIIQSPLLNYKNFKSTNYIFASEISHILLLLFSPSNRHQISVVRNLLTGVVRRMFVIKCSSCNSLFRKDKKSHIFQENYILIVKFRLKLDLNNKVKTEQSVFFLIPKKEFLNDIYICILLLLFFKFLTMLHIMWDGM